MTRKADHIRSLPVEVWHNLAMEGQDIPISIFLNGDSMSPLIRRNRDKVTLIPLRRPVKTGDIVLFRDAKGRYVVHRVWKQWANRVLTMGDHCMEPDVPMEMDKVWGLVIKVQRGNRELLLDSKAARGIGRLWIALLPLRRWRYRMKNRGNVHETQ